MSQVDVVMLQTQFYEPYGRLYAGTTVSVSESDARRWQKIGVVQVVGDPLPELVQKPSVTPVTPIAASVTLEDMLRGRIWTSGVPSPRQSPVARVSLTGDAQGMARGYWRGGRVGRHPGYRILVGAQVRQQQGAA